MSHRKSLMATLAELQKFSLEESGISELERMKSNIEGDYANLQEEAEQLRKDTLKGLEAGNFEVLNACRKKTERICSRLEELDDLRTKITDQIEKKTIRQRMTEFLGGSRNYRLLEIAIPSLIFLVLGLLAYDLTAGDDAGRPPLLQSHIIYLIDLGCCLVFLGEFFLRLHSSANKRYVWRNHWLDFVTSIPFPAGGQMIRFGRLARIVRLLRFIRFLRIFLLLWRGLDKFQDMLNVKLMKKTIQWSVCVTIVGAVAIYYLEGRSSAETEMGAEEIGNIPLAIWWSFTTLLTGGFGDIYNPVSVIAQVLTGIIVVSGMILIGVFTATLTSVFVGEKSVELEEISHQLEDRMDHLTRLAEANLDRGETHPE
ncbi:MAG: ion transporter [Planctomycetota bacterium]|nr:ion transporter [Planctomycetota bacterium]